MRLAEYQQLAKQTDQYPTRSRPALGSLDKGQLVPLLGLTGEIGALLSEYKKLLRDGPVHAQFAERLAEELGDTLWYVAATASHFGLSLEQIARANLTKVSDRWRRARASKPLDMGYSRRERLPQAFTYRFEYARRKDGRSGVALFDSAGRQVGDLLTDNSRRADGYRFHDVMHFAFVAVLGWSPVARKLLGRKRKSNALVDEVEDGGRAGVIDEAIVAMIFDYVGQDLGGTVGMTRVDTQTLRAIRALTRGLEVHGRTEAQWEEAILSGLSVWREVELADGGRVRGNFATRTFEFISGQRRTGRRLARATVSSPEVSPKHPR